MKMKNWGAALLGAVSLCLGLVSLAHAQSAALVDKSTTVPAADYCGAWVDTGNGIRNSGILCQPNRLQMDYSGVGSLVLTPNTYGLSAPGLLNNTSQKQFFFTKSVATTGQDAGDFECYRNANYVNTDHSHPELRGFVNTCMTTYTVVQPGGYQRFEWAHLVRLDNYSNIADDTENTALYAQARKLGTAPTFGFVTEIYDQTPNPAAGSVTDEHDMSAKGTDNNNARVIMDLWARNPWDSTATEVAWGIRLNTDANTKLKTGIKYNGHFTWGIDFSGATLDSGAINLGDGHPLALDTSGLRKLFFSSGVTYLSTPSGNLFSWNDAGQFTASNLNTSGGIYFGGLTTTYPLIRKGINAAVEIHDATNALWGNLMAGSLLMPAGGKLCFDDYACNRNLFYSAGVTYMGTPSGNVFSFSDAGGFTANSYVNASNTLYLNTNGKICLNGSGCSVYITYNGTTINFMSGSSAWLTINPSAGTVGVSSTGGLWVDLTPGVSCPSGINVSTFRSVKGVITAC